MILSRPGTAFLTACIGIACVNGQSDLVVLHAKTRREVKRVKIGRGAAGIQMQPDGLAWAVRR